MINFQDLRSLVIKHKIISAIVLIIILFAGYQVLANLSGKSVGNRYVMAAVERGDLINSITGSGQVSANNQVDIKAKTSGAVVYVGAVSGQSVSAGTLIAKLDTKDVEKNIRDAQMSLESAQLSYEKSLAQQAQQKRGDSLSKSYEDGLGILANFYDEFNTILNATKEMYYSYDLSQGALNNIEYYSSYKKEFSSVPNKVRSLQDGIDQSYLQALSDYQLAQRGSGDQRGKAIQSGYQLAVKMAEMIKQGRDVIYSLKSSELQGGGTHTRQTTIDSHLTNISSYAQTIDGYLKDLLAINNLINTQSDTLSTYTFDNKTQQMTLEQRRNSLQDAKDELENCYIRAPFSGTIASIDIKTAEDISNGATVATVITKEMVAEISLNEVDVAKVKNGQKATLTFDALDSVSISGEVAEVDSIGTVSQGVVMYNVKIKFDVQDERIKPGMSVSASIVTDIKQNVLMVPNSAVKSQNGEYYVEVLNNISGLANGQTVQSDIAPEKKSVVIGSANDSNTEIISGLEENMIIVSRIASKSATTTTATKTPSLFGGGGIRAGAPRD